jgi:hypothetical protein
VPASDRAKIADYYRTGGDLPEPYEADAGRKIVPEPLEDQVLEALASQTLTATPFRKPSGALYYARCVPDCNGHDGIRELCGAGLVGRVAHRFRRGPVRDGGPQAGLLDGDEVEHDVADTRVATGLFKAAARLFLADQRCTSRCHARRARPDRADPRHRAAEHVRPATTWDGGDRPSRPHIHSPRVARAGLEVQSQRSMAAWLCGVE